MPEYYKSSKSKSKKKSKHSADILAAVKNALIIVFMIGFISMTLWFYFNCYKPKEKRFIKNSRYAYIEISKIVHEIYREKQYVWERADETTDSVCEIIGKKLSVKGVNCTRSSFGVPQLNFEIGKTKIAIYGLEMPGVVQGDNIIKEFLIDTDGESEGANEIGVDRVPVQIHSKGRMGGRLMPVNCNVKDMINYNMPISKLCAGSTDLNFLTTNIPFGFDVNQIGSAEGKIKTVSRNIPFVRADCAAFGGEIIADEYCNDNGIYWLKRCYEEYYCGFEPAK